MAEKWLVTGAAGFIGSHLVEALLRVGEEVVGLDNFATGKRENVDDVLSSLTGHQRDRFRLIDGDIRDPDDCRRACAGVTRVLHQAAIGSVPRSIDDPLTTNEVNVTGHLNMMVAARGARVSSFVYASSSAVYGDSPTSPKKEGDEGRPISPYAASKRANEDYAAAFAAVYGMNVIGLRYFNVYGPRQDPAGQYAAVIPRWIGRLLAGQRCQIFGDGSTSRDLTYVGDVVAANLAAATSDAPSGVYNVAYGSATDLNELYRLLRSAVEATTGRPEVAALEPIYAPFRTGDVLRSLADTSRARAEFGFDPRVEIGTGLLQTVGWFAAQNASQA
ncbi:MAG TPA: SDR family oxidoreductase [Candidatus Limnocylindrales bacterium]|jgi:UDP-N-acetylglucosamine/UDP-N-acetylgalactosamine 4-epimerase|nr:SDR family oxidoreductase [Candidatus Limnocylindrales bacterium]